MSSKSLADKLAARPSKDDLKAKGVVVCEKSHGKLHGAMADLQKAQMKDKLHQQLRSRPSKSQLVEQGKLKAEHHDGKHAKIVQQGEKLEKAMKMDNLNRGMRNRPSVADLHEAGLVDANEHYKEVHEVHAAEKSSPFEMA